MQATTSDYSDYQYLFPSWPWTWPHPHQGFHRPTTPSAPNIGDCSTATYDRKLQPLAKPSAPGTSGNAPLPETRRKRTLPRLLPASARFSVSEIEPIVVSNFGDAWLAKLLRRLKKIRLSSHSHQSHRDMLVRLLAADKATWSLASIMLPAAPIAHGPKHPDLPAENKCIRITGGVLYVDLVKSHEVCFKLTDATIEALSNYHHNVHCAALRTNAGDNVGDIESRLDLVKNQFTRSIRAFVFRTGKSCLHAMEVDGSGELDLGRRTKVRSAISALFKPLPETTATSTSRAMLQLEVTNVLPSWEASGIDGTIVDWSWREASTADGIGRLPQIPTGGELTWPNICGGVS